MSTNKTHLILKQCDEQIVTPDEYCVDLSPGTMVFPWLMTESGIPIAAEDGFVLMAEIIEE